MVNNKINFGENQYRTIFYNNQQKLARLDEYFLTIRERLSGLGLSLPGLLSTLTHAVLLFLLAPLTL